LETDALEPERDLRRMYAGVPDVADLERRDELEGLRPVDTGIAAERCVPVALDAHVRLLGRPELVVQAVPPAWVERHAVGWVRCEELRLRTIQQSCDGLRV